MTSKEQVIKHLRAINAELLEALKELYEYAYAVFGKDNPTDTERHLLKKAEQAIKGVE